MTSADAALRRGLRHIGGYLAFAGHVATHLRALRVPPVREVFHRQLYFSGIQGLRLTAILGLIAGAIVVTQATALVGADSELSVRVLGWTVIGELGPLLAAVILIARSGVAVATELALMASHREAETLASLRIPPMDYLVVPRVAALTLSSIALTIYFQAVAVAGGLGASALFQNASFLTQLGRFLNVLSFAEFGASLLKSAVFGATVAVVACYHGLNSPPTITSVPVAATQSVIHGLVAVFLADVLFAYLRFAVL